MARMCKMLPYPLALARALLLLIGLAFWASGAQAQSTAAAVQPGFYNGNCLTGQPCPNFVPYYGGAQLGYQQVTSMSSSTALTVPVDGRSLPATKAFICVEAQGVRWRDDGTAPTSTVGQFNLSTAGSCMWYNQEPLANLRFILITAGAILNVNYYGSGN